MSKKIYLLLGLLLLTACNSTNLTVNKPLPSETARAESSQTDVERVENFLKQINQEIKLGFSDPGHLDFNWKIAGEKLSKIRNLETVQISGQAIALFSTPRIEKKSNTPIVTVIANYLSSQGFVKDIYNNNAGTVTGTEAYQNKDMKCIINWEIIGGIEGYKTTDVPMNLALVCGEI